MLELHKLKPAHGARKERRRVGRGDSSGMGSTSTRGGKGQTSRSGVSGLQLKGFRRNLMRTPKLRGNKKRSLPFVAINLYEIEKYFDAKSLVNRKTLQEKGMVKGKGVRVKILGNGELTKPMTFASLAFSESAKQKISASGGTIQ